MAQVLTTINLSLKLPWWWRIVLYGALALHVARIPVNPKRIAQLIADHADIKVV